MENTNIVTTEQQAPNTISASNAIFNVQALGQLTAFANLMADSQVTVPAHLAGKPADCMAIVMQAMQWGMNPYAVAQKTHLVNGVLGYEAQLVNAVIASSSAIHGRFHYRYGGDWERCTRTQEITRDKNGKNGKYTVTERVRGWTMRTRSACSFRLVPFCEVNLKSPGENLFTSPALLPAILRYGFQTLNSKLPIWALNIGLACTARK
ncbi:hypothetical protein SEL4126_11820 [Salmonella enterica subsp. enterica serovar Typhimurium]|uniref:Recombinase RecT n=1 Tax=Salmonella typhimurium TaxID=90371 RepID=A0A8D5C200_SALTM|nr:hypothetical protein SEL4126_11820 [Salmonella enterica subsp. enterica serovar Typhimurium]